MRRCCVTSPPSVTVPRQHRIERIGHVVLPQFPAAPARDIEEAVIERQVDVRHQRRHSLEALEQRRKLVRIGRLGGNLDDLAESSTCRCRCALRDARARSTTTGLSATSRRRRIRRSGWDRAKGEARAPSVAPGRGRAFVDGAACADPRRWSAWPYLPPSRSSGFTPSSTMEGVPHSLVIMVSCPRCHQKS